MGCMEVLGIKKESEMGQFILEIFSGCPICAQVPDTDVAENETASWPPHTCGERYTQIITLWETLKQSIRREFWEDGAAATSQPWGGHKASRSCVLNYEWFPREGRQVTFTGFLRTLIHQYRTLLLKDAFLDLFIQVGFIYHIFSQLLPSFSGFISGFNHILNRYI